MMFNKTNNIFIFIAIIFIGIILYVLTVPVDCKNDRNCFNQNAANCRISKLTIENNGNIYTYEVFGGSKNNSCVVEIKLLKTSPITSIDIKELFEGKSMKCNFPKEQLRISPVQETSNILNYCTGPLKEATLELMINKLYGTIAQNLGPIINQVAKNQTISSLINPNTYVTSNGSMTSS